MSHKIESNDKQQGLTMAWHGLTEINPELSLDNNWLRDWDIQARGLVLSEPGGGVIVTDFSILTATDDPSIVIGRPFADSYHPIANASFVQLMKDATEGVDNMKLISVGSVRNRGRVFASFETHILEEYAAGGRKFKPYFNLGNGHDQSSVLWANTSNVCTVCDNTFQMNLSQVEEKIVQAVRVRHTKNMAMRLPDLGLILRQANQLHQEFAVAFEGLAETLIDQENAERFFVGFVVDTDESESALSKISTRARNIVDRLMDLFKTGRGNKGATLADLFSAATEYYTHENAGNGKNPWKQYHSSEFGAGSSTKNRVFEIVKDQERVAEIIAKGAKLLEASQD